MLGLNSPAEVEGKPFSQFIDSHCLKEVEAAFAKVLTGESLEFPCNLKRGDEVVQTKSYLFPLVDEDGCVFSVFGMSFDETETRLAMEALQRSEKRYRQIFETNMAVKFILNPETGILEHVNEAACWFYGYSRDELEGMHISKINELPFEEIQQKMVGAVEKSRLYFEFRHRLKNGDIRDVEVFTGPVDTAEGLRLYSIVHDVTDRKRVERELRESKERFALAILGSNDGIWDIDFVKKTTFWSDRCKELLGFASTEIEATKENRVKHFHPKDLPRVRQAIKRHLKFKEPYDLAARLLHKDGRYLWFRIRGQAIWDAEDRPLRMAGSMRNIHDHHEMVKQLRLSEQRFAAAVEGSRDGVWDWDILTGRSWWSTRLKNLLGYADDELHASREVLCKIMHPDDREKTRKEAERVLRLGLRFNIRYRLQTKNGEYRWFLSRGRVLMDDSGRPIRASGVLSDIHDEMVANQAKEARQARLEKQHQCILALASDPELASMSLHRAFQKITEHAAKVLNVGRCSVSLSKGNNSFLECTDLYVSKSKKHFHGKILKWSQMPLFFDHLKTNRALVSRNPQLDSRFDEFPRAYFRERRIRSSISVALRRFGRVVGMISVSETEQERDWQEDEVDFVLDLAQQVVRLLEQDDARKAKGKQEAFERKMLQAQKIESLGLMAGGVAHDFNNFLLAILGNADLLAEMVPPNSRQQNLVQEVIAASQRATELCQQMLAFSGRHSMQRVSFQLNELVREMRQLLQVTLAKGASLQLECQENLPKMNGDPTQVRQVLMNLILNASESLVEGEGQVTVRTRLQRRSPDLHGRGLEVPIEGQYLCLEVQDSGVGMTPFTMDKLFDPFFSTKFAGRGLGLASVMGIVRAHQGGIHVESTLGKGSCFQVFFPIMEEPLQEAAETPQSPRLSGDAQWRGEGKVLLVDDDSVVLNLCQEMLKRLGFDVLCAADGQQALDIFREQGENLVLVLLDLTMPGLSGEEVFRRMREQHAEIPMVLSSGYSAQDIAQQIGPEPHLSFLQKPYVLEQLREHIRQAINH